MRYLGFGTFILLIFSVLVTLIFFYFGLYPHVLIEGLNTPEKNSTASWFLLILAGFTKVTVLRRLVEMIYKILVDNFISKRIFLIGSAVTLSSVFYLY